MLRKDTSPHMLSPKHVLHLTIDPTLKQGDKDDILVAVALDI